MKKVFFILFAGVLMASCTTVYYTYDYNESTARNLEPEHVMLTTPVIADLEVSSTRITHVERDAYRDIAVDNFTIQPENIEGYKKIALSKAAKAHDADVLVASMIDVQTIDGRLVITVTGFPAKYKNFRKATLQDADLMQRASFFRNNDNDAIIASPTQDERIELTSKRY